MKKVTAVLEVWYAGKTRMPGETFEAIDQDAAILNGTGKTKDADADEGMQHIAPSVLTRQMKSEEAVQPAEQSPRRYRRRDMKAEE